MVRQIDGATNVFSAEPQRLASHLSDETTGELLPDEQVVPSDRLLPDFQVELRRFALQQQLASLAAAAPPEVQARFKDYFPDIDFSKYREHSAGWSLANVQALGSEYTSRPWDVPRPEKKNPFVDSPGWGHFVGEAYKDVNASGVFR